MWTNYRVTWLFLTKLCASVPGDPKLVEAWIEARKPKVRVPGGKSINEIQEEVFDTLGAVEEEEQHSMLVFQRIDGRLVMRAATVRAHIKDCARVLSAQYIGSISGERQFSTRVINGVYPDEREYWIPILRPEGDPVLEADGRMDKAIHVRDAQGRQQNALKTFEYVEPARMDFTIRVLTARPGAVKLGRKKDKNGEKVKPIALPSVSGEDLAVVFQYGGVHGYGGERGDGEGKYTFTLDELK
jgi:hypothetical protein